MLRARRAMAAGVLFDGRRLLPYSLDFSALADGALPAGWTGSTWAIASGKAVNTPTLGSDLVINGGFDADSDWVKEAGWTISGGVAVGGSTSNNIYQQVAATHDWISMQFDLVSRTAGFLLPRLGNFQSGKSYLTPATGIGFAGPVTLTGAPGLVGFKGSTLFAGTVDNVEAKKITQSTMFAIRNAGQKDLDITGTYSVLGVMHPLGVLANVAPDFSSGLVAWIDTVYIHLAKWVGSTWTLLITTTGATPTGNKLPQIKTHRDGANLLVDVFYNDVQKGTQQTVSDAEIINNTYYGMFSAKNTNSIATIVVDGY